MNRAQQESYAFTHAQVKSKVIHAKLPTHARAVNSAEDIAQDLLAVFC